MTKHICRRCGDELKLKGASLDIIHTQWGHFECRSGHVELFGLSDKEWKQAVKEVDRHGRATLRN